MKFLIKIIPAFLVAFSSCDMLKTRTPEEPTVGTQSKWEQPVTPEITIENLKNAIFDRNTENYIKCFVDTNFSDKSFKFVPNKEAKLQYPQVFVDWGLDDERNYFNNLKSSMLPGGNSSLVLSGDFKGIWSDSAIYAGEYLLVFEHSIKEIPQSAKGSLQFYLAPDKNRNWVIFKWVDVKSGENFSWSDLKAKFSY